MFMQGIRYGIVSHLRICLASDFWGNTPATGSGTPVARVDSAIHPNDFLEGQSKLKTPYIMCVPGDTNVKSPSHAGATAKTQMVERLEVYAVLDSTLDQIKRAPADILHTVRLDILKCLHGWNPGVTAKCEEPAIPYGYCPQNFIYVGDSHFESDNERVTWLFDFELESTVTTQAQGFGPSNPVASEPLERIFTDWCPSEITASEQPYPESDLDVS
jgi:hypothetical protein